MRGIRPREYSTRERIERCPARPRRCAAIEEGFTTAVELGHARPGSIECRSGGLEESEFVYPSFDRWRWHDCTSCLSYLSPVSFSILSCLISRGSGKQDTNDLPFLSNSSMKISSDSVSKAGNKPLLLYGTQSCNTMASSRMMLRLRLGFILIVLGCRMPC